MGRTGGGLIVRVGLPPVDSRGFPIEKIANIKPSYYVN